MKYSDISNHWNTLVHTKMTIIRHASFKKELDVAQPQHTKTSMYMYSYQI